MNPSVLPKPSSAPTPRTGMHRASLFFQSSMSILNQSAMVSLAERNAVSPDVIGQAMTPSMARTIPIPPIVCWQM